MRGVHVEGPYPRALFTSFGLIVLLWLCWCLIGCTSTEWRRPLPPENMTTPNGTFVYVPWWVPRNRLAAVLDEIDDAGVPKGWSVEITIPVFETPYAESGLARGLADFAGKRLIVGWRIWEYEKGCMLPALKHEVGHALYGPGYGH